MENPIHIVRLKTPQYFEGSENQLAVEGQKDCVNYHALRSVGVLSEYHYFSDGNYSSKINAK
jgi:hypothetical protein